jgi:hypothetical protein
MKRRSASGSDGRISNQFSLVAVVSVRALPSGSTCKLLVIAQRNPFSRHSYLKIGWSGGLVLHRGVLHQGVLHRGVLHRGVLHRVGVLILRRVGAAVSIFSKLAGQYWIQFSQHSITYLHESRYALGGYESTGSTADPYAFVGSELEQDVAKTITQA